jgi:hypothetical protein
LVTSHSLVQQENLNAKPLKITEVLTSIPKLVNPIMSEGTLHNSIKYLISDMEREQGSVVYCTKVHWLTCDRMLKAVHDFKSKTTRTTLKHFPQLCNHPWMCGLTLCIASNGGT